MGCEKVGVREWRIFGNALVWNPLKRVKRERESERKGGGGRERGMEEVGSTYVCSSVTIWMNSLLQTILNHNPLRKRQRLREREMGLKSCFVLCHVVSCRAAAFLFCVLH